MEQPYEVHNPVDIIFCRNVLIYFERPRQEAVLKNLAMVLQPGGFLVVGHAESIVHMDLGLDYFAPTVYRKARG
jgi:chemotaxis protein methyltransferase CheR